MIFKEKTKIFSLKDMKLEEVFSFNLESESNLIVNGMIYEDGIISKIKFERCKSYDPKDKDFLLIRLFIGNLNLGDIVAHKDYILTKNSKSLEYILRKTESYDYLEIKTNPLHRVHQ